MRVVVITAQLALLTGFALYAIVAWTGPNNELINFNVSALTAAVVIGLALAAWIGGHQWPILVINGLLAGFFAFGVSTFDAWVPIFGWAPLAVLVPGLAAALSTIMLVVVMWFRGRSSD